MDGRGGFGRARRGFARARRGFGGVAVVVDAMLVATVSVREDEVPAVVVVLIDAAVVVCTVVVDDASEPVVACTVVVDDASEPVLAVPRETSTDSTSAASFEWCDAAVACELRVAFEAVDWADLGQQIRRRHSAAARQFEQCRRELDRPPLELAVKLDNDPVERAAAGNKLACEPHLQRSLPTAEPATDALQVSRPVERFRGDDESRVKLV
jgi:hypothetical protein